MIMKSQLIIEISEYAVKFSHMKSGICEEVDYFTFKERIDYRYKEQLEQIFQEKKYKERSYDDYTLTWYSPLSTLLPNNVFSETKAEEVFKLCFSKDVPNSNIDYNRISELSMVNIYEIPLWVKSFFVIKFPRIIIQHEGSFLLRSIFKGTTFHLNCSIIIHNESFNIILANKNELLFYSNYSFLNSDDIVYHFKYALQQKDIQKENGSIQLIHGIGANEEILIETIEKLKKFKDSSHFTIQTNSQLIINSHLQCV